VASRWIERALFLRCLVCAALVWSSPAHAESYESALLDGVTVRDRALETGDPDDWQRAIAHLDRALSYRVTAEALFERARAIAALGKSAESASDYESAIEIGLGERAREFAARYVAEHEAEFGRLLIRGPAGATLTIVGRRPLELPMDRPLPMAPGNVAVRLEAPLTQPWEGTLQIDAGELATRDVQLAPTAPADGIAVHRSSAVAWGRGFTIAGGGLAAAGALTAFVTSLLLPSARDDLDAHCLETGRDGCVRALEPDRLAAQAAADRVHSLEMARWAGVATLLAGAAGVVAGLTLFPASTANGSGPLALVWAADAASGSPVSLLGLRGHF
jgi:hypothetical protein